jgi:tetratricopeptide (TPR) repeat protein
MGYCMHYPMSLLTHGLLLLYILSWMTPRCSSFAPATQKFFDRNRIPYLHSNVPIIHRVRYPFLQAAATVTSVEPTTLPEPPQKEFSYAAILKVIDESHHQEVTESCPYLANELVTRGNEVENDSIHSDVRVFHSPDVPVLSDDAVDGLRFAAQKYFAEKGREHNNGVSTIDRVDLGELLSMEVGHDPEWRKNLDAALMHDIYPSVRSNWLRNPANKLQSAVPLPSPVLTVTSAAVFAGGMCTGTQAALTTLERDAGMFMVHIDLGNDIHIGNDDETQVMGALYIESLVNNQASQSNESIVGPLLPGQMVVHKSSERTAAIVVPSNIHDLMTKSEATDCISRTQILRAAERSRHFVLRLVVTTTNNYNAADGDIDGKPTNIAEAPSEERSYRLRNYARFSGDGRARYLTLAGLLDLGDYENHLWLGFDYIARIENPHNQFDLHQRLSDANKAVFHLETAAKLCPTDSRVYFQLATAIGAKMEVEMRLKIEGDNFITEPDEKSNLLRMADALERSAQLESAAVKVGVNGVQDLAICLNMLAETWCKAGEFDKALGALDRWAECGSIRSALSIEDTSTRFEKNTPSYEWIQATDEFGGKTRHVAVKTIGDVPVFESEDITLLRAAADKRFALANGVQTSRYTMQYEGMSVILFCCMQL